MSLFEQDPKHTMCISIIHTGADDSNTEYEIVTMCISSSIIHTGADDYITESFLTLHHTLSLLLPNALSTSCLTLS